MTKIKNKKTNGCSKLAPSQRFVILMGSLILIDLLFSIIYITLSNNYEAIIPAVTLSLLFLGLINVLGCRLIIKPIRDLETDDHNALNKVTRRLQKLSFISAFWIFCLTITYTIVNFSIGVFIMDEAGAATVSFEKGLIAAFWFAGIYAVQFSFYAYFVAMDCAIYARRWFAENKNILLRSAYVPLRIRLLIGMGMIAFLPASVIMLDVLYFNDIRAVQGLNLESAILLDSAATLIAAITSIVFISRSFTSPVEHLQQTMQQLTHSQENIRAAEMTDDELGELSRRFNTLSKELEEKNKIRNMLNKFVNKDVAERLVVYGEQDKRLKGELRLATVMFTDIAGFTTWSENISPSQLINILNTYFNIVSSIIRAHNGVILNYIGDSVYVVFNIPNEDANHAKNAINCALEIQQALEDVFFEGGIKLPTRFGINSGAVVAGVVGTKDHLEYSVYGDVVNVAARLEQLNKNIGSTILISNATARLAWEMKNSNINFVDEGEQNIRGKAGNIHVFSVASKKLTSKTKNIPHIA